MLKRLMCVPLIVIFILSLPVYTFATDAVEITSVIYLEDGSYITITIDEIGSRASGTKSGKKHTPMLQVMELYVGMPP